MDEEKMWKGFYEKLQEIKECPTEHEKKLQDADGGFFEKFGSLLRQKSHLDEQNLEISLAPFTDNETDDDINTSDASNIDGLELNEEKCMSILSNDLQVHESSQSKEEFFENTFGMNIEDLYEEILFEINNNIGCDVVNVCSEELIEFVQDAFKITNEKHENILKNATNKEPPNIRLNVEIIKAENLMPKDSNGLSDPFITLYLESNSSHRYNSSVKSGTLNPIWEEHFSLPILDNPRSEVLIIEIWDFDAAETVKEKVNKFFDVKGVKGIRKLMKEIAVTASTGNHDNELIGRTVITLKSISTSGTTTWFELSKGIKTKSRGSILVNLTLSAEKNKHVAVQEHRRLLKLLLMHELETSQVAQYWWSGKFSPKAEIIRSQHSVQSGLSQFECALCQWSTYGEIHEQHPLSFCLFNNILDTIVPVLKCCLQPNSEDLKFFWDGAKRILPSCFSIIRKLHSRNVSEKQIVKTLCEVLDIIAKLKLLEVSTDIEVFPISKYGWLSRPKEEIEYTIDDVINDAVNIGAKEWLEQVMDSLKNPAEEGNDESELQYLINVIQVVRTDIQRVMEYFDKHFYQKLRINYSTSLFRYYDTMLSDVIHVIVVNVCSHIKRLDIPDDQFQYVPNVENLNMGTTLFELYLILKRFQSLGNSLCPNDDLKIAYFHQWFIPGVTHWLEISIIKALNRIEKAIDLDLLQAVDDTVKYSSSAVDTLAIFYQIKIFWKQLDWPDIEGSYTFVGKIVDDICRCCIFYAQRMSRRVEAITSDNENMFYVSNEWCLAINNIDYIRQSLPAFIKELGIDEIIQKLAEYRSKLEADRCEETIRNVIDNALDTERNQILELIEVVARKMAPSLRRFLAEGSEILHEDSNSMERLMIYLEDSLKVLYESLNEINFGRILDAIWSELSVIMYDLIQYNLEKRRPPSFFQNLRRTLQVMISSFKIGNIVTSDVEILTEIEKTLDLHAFETADLIHQYYLERFGYQKECSKSEYGQLTIKAKFSDRGIVINIMNARNLVPMDSNGTCDSFVKAHFMPTNRFLGVSPIKTQVQSKTRFPLYDEEFEINLTMDQRSNQNSLILFSIKDKDLFGMTNQYIAECYTTFADIMAYENEQIHMELSRPEYIESDTIRALEYRQGDKQAKEFLKKLKNKSY